MIKNIRLPSLQNKVLLADVLFLVVTTSGIMLTISGLFVMILAATLPAEVSGVELLQQSVLSVLGLIPGVPINMNDLEGSSLTAIGMVSWIVGLDLLVVGLGLWVRSKVARWIAIIVFTSSVFFNFVQFLLLGLLGAPMATVSLLVNALILYLLWKVDLEDQTED